MCGIAGAVGAVPRAEMASRVEALARALAHRGPDGRGLHSEALGSAESVALGHVRLAIIDPAGGEQPMHSECGRLHLVYNGELYNFEALREELRAAGHRFRTQSDTEVLLIAYRHWGIECLHRLRGMYAFAIWDDELRRLFVARDRFGEKPLLYANLGGAFVFASELRAFLQWPGFAPAIDEEALPLYLQFRYAPAPLTLLRGVRKLRPGCYGLWRDHGFTEHRYYTPPDARPIPPRDASIGDAGKPDASQTIPQEFLQCLDGSVASMMRSDVPYGAFLSGGIDSSAIVSLMARHSSQPINTFSVGFEDARFSELAHADRVARAFGTRHQAITIRNADVADLLVGAVAHRDGPLSEPADLPLLVLARLASRSVKMILSGEGSDEALGGYPKHVVEGRMDTFQRIPAWLRNAVMRPVIAALPFEARRLRIAAAALQAGQFTERMPRWFGALSADDVTALVGQPPGINGCAFPFESDESASPLRRALFFDQTSWLPDNLLERGDRITMAASVEARMPFMDHTLIEFVSSLPDRLRVSGRRTKVVLREAMRGLLPDEVLARPKVGFGMPTERWLRAELRPLLADALLSAESFCGRRMDRRLVSRYVQEHLGGRRNHDKTLWMLLNLELWAREMRL